MRIAIVTDFYYPALGGISEHVDGQARALTALGHDVTVITGNHIVQPTARDDDQPPPEPTFELLRIGTIIPHVRAGLGQQRPDPARDRAVARASDSASSFASGASTSSTCTRPTTRRCRPGRSSTRPYDALSVATFHSVFPPTTGMDILGGLDPSADRAARRAHLRVRGLHRLAHALLPVRLPRDPQRHRRRPVLARRRAGRPS